MFKITLDFVGVTLRMFQSLGMLSNSKSNSEFHVHLESLMKFKIINRF